MRDQAILCDNKYKESKSYLAAWSVGVPEVMVTRERAASFVSKRKRDLETLSHSTLPQPPLRA